ncbi:MAG: anti-sigma factor family protein [Vitreimonas sp.]
MSVDDDKLMAFADGELTPAERAEIEQALAQDPALRERVAAHRRLRADLAQAYAGALDEPVPQHLRDILQPPQQQAASAEIVQLAQRRAPNWSMREWGAMAASLAAGLVLAFGLIGANPPMIAATDNGLSARGPLAAALDRQLAADEGGAVRIGVSFRAQDGAYCRTFDLTRKNTSGLACRGDGGWRVDMTAAHVAGGEVRMADSAPEILAAVDARIAGAPLDATAEARARDAGWR